MDVYKKIFVYQLTQNVLIAALLSAKKMKLPVLKERIKMVVNFQTNVFQK